MYSFTAQDNCNYCNASLNSAGALQVGLHKGQNSEDLGITGHRNPGSSLILAYAATTAKCTACGAVIAIQAYKE